jgi:outer membrane receptor for ferrienterochelin and colicin
LNLRSNLLVSLLLGLSLHAQESSVTATPSKTGEKLSRHQETIVVTGTFPPVTEPELDRSISVIETEGQELLYQNWTEYLELSSSVDLRQRALADVQGDISIRGSTFGQTLVMLNGLRMNDVQTAHHDMVCRYRRTLSRESRSCGVRGPQCMARTPWLEQST